MSITRATIPNGTTITALTIRGNYLNVLRLGTEGNRAVVVEIAASVDAQDVPVPRLRVALGITAVDTAVGSSLLNRNQRSRFVYSQLKLLSSVRITHGKHP